MAENESKRDETFIESVLNDESCAESLISRGYAIVNFPTETSLLYSSFYFLCQSFFGASDQIKQKYSQIQFDEGNKSPNSLHGYSAVKGKKEQFMIRYANSTSHPALKQLKTPNNDFISETANGSTAGTFHLDFGVASLVLFEKLDNISRNIMSDVLTLFNKGSQEILDGILDPINKVHGAVIREKGNNDSDHCHGEYTLDGYVSSSVLDAYHYLPSEQGQYGHDVHADSGLLTVIPVTSSNPSLQVLDQKENEWINVEALIQDYCKSKQKNESEFGVVLLGESVEPYINRHIQTTENRLKACYYRIDNGEMERHSVVFKQRTAPLRSHARYQEDFFLAKMHSEIDAESIHSRLMKEGTTKGNDSRNYKYYEYSSGQKTKTAVCSAIAVMATAATAIYILKKRNILLFDVQYLGWK